jgi:hypothetical protein
MIKLKMTKITMVAIIAIGIGIGMLTAAFTA